MAEPNNANPGAPAAGEPNNNNQNGNGSGTPPAAPKVDFKNMSADQIEQALENQNLWQNPRMKDLIDSKKALAELKAQQAKDEDEALAKGKKFEELASKKGEEVESLKTQIQTFTIDRALTGKLIGEKVVDLDAALKLINRTNLKIGDNDNVQGVDEAINDLKQNKAYLFGTGSGTPPLGSPSNPNANNNAGPVRFKRSQLTQAFIKENYKAVMEANRLGLIEDDGAPGSR